MKKTCLVVDDSKIVRKVTRKIFESLDYNVLEAEDGSLALEQCLKEMPDLIMLDWHMPVMNGLEFLVALRATPGGTTPVVIFCTTETEFSRIQQAILAGANEYVMKPFDEDIIRGKLQQLGFM
jgi:two-component system, chemotaxis family, chemotaxis protein CheY